MDSAHACPRCGAPRLANAPAGLCPRCLLRNGLAAGRLAGPGEGAADFGVTPSVNRHRPRPSGILSAVDETFGPVPRVLLRDGPADGERPALPCSEDMPASAGDAGSLPAPRRDRSRGHGHRPQGPRRRRRPRRGRQGPPGEAPRQPRDGPPVRRGGADRRPAPAPGHRPGLRAGPAPRRAALHRHEADPGPYPGRPPRRPGGHGRGPAEVSRSLRADVPDDGLRPRMRRDPPRPEALERHGGQLRRGPGHGLGARQGDWPGGRRRRGAVAPEPGGCGTGPHATHRLLGRRVAGRLGTRHSLLYGPRAGPGPAGHARRTGGRLRPRRDPLRDPHRRCRPIRGRAATRSTTKRHGRTWPRPWPGSTAAAAEAELVALAKSCLAAAPRDRPRDAGVVAAP